MKDARRRESSPPDQPSETASELQLDRQPVTKQLPRIVITFKLCSYDRSGRMSARRSAKYRDYLGLWGCFAHCRHWHTRATPVHT